MTDPEKFVPVNTPLLAGNEKKYLNECIDTGWISSEGPFVSRFEEAFAAYVNRKYAVAVTNGTAALDAAIAALDIGPGDEVIVPSFTIISCITQILRAGATPVFIDSETKTWNMDVSQIEDAITPRTKAIMMVHIYGMTVDADEVIALADKYNLKVIEDAAEAIGQTYNENICGSLGDISTFSFYPNKHITTGEGGMVVTNDEALADRCRSLRNLCFQPAKRFVHEELGWNLRMTNLQAALGLAQLEVVEQTVTRKRETGYRYNELLSSLDGVTLPIHRTAYSENIYWVYGLLLDAEHPLDAETAMRQLGSKGVGTRPFFYPLHQQPVVKKMGLISGSYPVAEHLYKKGFYIPSGLGLTDSDIDYVAKTVREVLTQ